MLGFIESVSESVVYFTLFIYVCAHIYIYIYESLLNSQWGSGLRDVAS